MTTPRLDDLPAIHQACWQQLAACTADKAHAWRVLGLATADGGLPDLRSVVLREVDVPARTLMFFTDARSPKVGQITAQPQATLLAWSPVLGWQLRLRVRPQLRLRLRLRLQLLPRPQRPRPRGLPRPRWSPPLLS